MRRGVLFASVLLGCAHPQPSAPPRPRLATIHRATEPPPPSRPPLRHGLVGTQVYLNQSGTLIADARTDGIFPPATQQKLKKGIAAEVVWRVRVFAPNETNARASGTFTCKVAYDMWNDVFRITTSLAGATPPVVNFKGVALRCLQPVGIPLVVTGTLRPGVAHRIVATAAVDTPTPSATYVVEGVYVP